MKFQAEIQIPELWGSQKFVKNEWGPINFLVGPNGTGKTLFAEKLKTELQTKGGVKPRYLSAERLVGFEKGEYLQYFHTYMKSGLNLSHISEYKTIGNSFGSSGDAYIRIKEKLDVRIKIEATLSDLFGKQLRLVEEGGFLNPKIQNIGKGSEYVLREKECHGLKELISLLTFIYDDEFDCLIIDEPELHLHPQFQSFFLQEIRKVAGIPKEEPDKKIFFIITHSPYFVDIRTIDELRHCIVFQSNKLPAYVNEIDGEDERRIRRLLPRLNTHHKQFFFASRPIFVEGYFDQQLFTLIQEKRNKIMGAAGACFIDVSGKDEMDLYFRLCKKLNLDAQFIADLDALFRSKLRQTVSVDDRCKLYSQEQGLGIDLMKVIGDMEREIDSCIKEIESKRESFSSLGDIEKQFVDALLAASEDYKKRGIFIIGLNLMREAIEKSIIETKDNLNFIRGMIDKIYDAFKESGVHLLPKGELENCLPSYKGNPFLLADNKKADIFNAERDFLLEAELSEEGFLERYGELIGILDNASPSVEIDYIKHLNYLVGDFIHAVQQSFERGEIQDESSLQQNARVGWSNYERIFELVEFLKDEKEGFKCNVKIKPLIDPAQREITFDQDTVPSAYKI